MSHTFISFRAHDIQIHDLDLCVISHLAVELSKDEEIRKFFLDMEWIGPGVVLGTDLELFLNGDNCKIKKLIGTLDKTKNLILSFGSHVPLSYIVHCKTFNFVSDYPSSGCVIAINSIIDMLNIE